LGHGIELVERLARRFSVLDQRREHLKAGDKAVPRSAVVREDDVAGLLATDIAAALAHRFQHIAVADLRADQFQPLCG
jgi:hypothetical protein